MDMLARIRLCLCCVMLWPAESPLAELNNRPVLLQAKQVFDGHDFRADTAILVENGRISEIGPRSSVVSAEAQVIELGDATLLPGFIELHAHLRFRQVPAETVLKHGITTLREVGGPVYPPNGGDGSLRMMTSGPIITAPGGYPIPNLGADNIAIPVATEQQARATVRQLIADGAVIIKVALEPGSETGAPWTAHAEHRHSVNKKWPLLPEAIVKAIVDEAGRYQRKVTAHIGERTGARIALDAGVAEWAHMPCGYLPDALLQKAVSQHVKIVTTFDTLSKCPGVPANAKRWAEMGGEFLYGAEIAHSDIPWGIDAQELIDMMHLAHMPLVEVLRSATAKAGSYLGIPLLGTLSPGAPADLIAVKGSLVHDLKKLEYPELVMSGGKLLVNNFQTE